MKTSLILDRKQQDALAHLDEVVAGRPETDGKLRRLEGITVTIRLAPDAKVEVNDREYSREAGNVNDAGYGVVTGAGWELHAEDPYRACLKVNDGKRGVRWLVHQTIAHEGLEAGNAEHPLTAFHIKVDEKNRVYCLAQYASLQLDGECITCPDGTVVCGIDPWCNTRS